ncbi:MAG: cyclic nucleotide-binding domain-containing protein [Bacteroidota bacterium]
MNQEQVKSFINEFLKSFEELKFDVDTIHQIRHALKVIRIKSKDTLIISGEVCRNIYLVAEGGFVCRYIHEKSGEAKTINFYLKDLHPFMACLDSYFTQTPTNCELKAVSDSVVLALPKSIVDELNQKDPQFTKFHYEVVITAIVEENEVKTKLIAYSSKEKYDFIMQEMPSVIQAVPSKYIAEFCGISQEWLSKLKKQA